MSESQSVALPLLPWPQGGPTAEPKRELGVLAVQMGAERERSPLPLAAVAIAARMAEGIAEVTLTETFHNPYSETLEAVYVFPLPGGGAVCDFELRVGDRTLRGEVRERGAARKQYRDALSRGRRAALLEQERDDVFTVQVGNLPPGEQVSVRLTYVERVPFFEDGTSELRLPLVVAPRYVPGEPLSRDPSGRGVEPDTDLVPDASRISPPRLAPGFDPRVALAVDVALLGELTALSCSQHAISTKLGTDGVQVSLAREEEPLDRDFVLRWKLGGAEVHTSFRLHAVEGEAGYGLLTIVPPSREGFLGLARDVVFVLDRSGSMSGVKMTSAARACSILLATLGPRDRFAIEAFDDRQEWMPAPGTPNPEGGSLVSATVGAVEAGHRYLREVESRGGTELDAAVAAALRVLAGRASTVGRAPVLVLLTDGQIGDEHRVLRRLQGELGEVRVFTVGIDTAVNESFLTRLAALGGGTATLVEPGVGLETALAAVGREIGTPLVVDVSVEDVDAGIDGSSLTPERMPDLFAGRPVSLGLRAVRPGRLRVRGRFADGTDFAQEVLAQPTELPAIAHVWARSRVRDLEDLYRMEPGSQKEIERQIIELAVRHTLLTRFTAFVVVDETEVVSTGEGRTVVQPVEIPAQWAPQALHLAASGPAAAPSEALNEFMEAPSFDEDLASPSPAPPRPMAKARSKSPRGAASQRGYVGAIEERPQPWSGDPQAVVDALAALEEALAQARRELGSGRVPAVAPLVAARARLLAALAGWEGSVELPALQRFVRTGLPELIAACESPGATPQSLEALFALHGAAFAEARAAAAAVFEGTTAGPSWGKTV